MPLDRAAAVDDADIDVAGDPDANGDEGVEAGEPGAVVGELFAEKLVTQ